MIKIIYDIMKKELIEMKEEKGKVKKVFIPVEENEDIMESTKIGFEIKLAKKEIEIIEEQNEENVTILKNDKVVVKEIEKEKYVIEKVVE